MSSTSTSIPFPVKFPPKCDFHDRFVFARHCAPGRAAAANRKAPILGPPPRTSHRPIGKSVLRPRRGIGTQLRRRTCHVAPRNRLPKNAEFESGSVHAEPDIEKKQKKTQLEASISSRRMFSTDAKIEGCCLSSRRPRTLDHVESIISYHNHNQSSLARGVFFGAKTDGLVGVGQTNPRINSVIITGALVYFEWFVIQPLLVTEKPNFLSRRRY